MLCHIFGLFLNLFFGFSILVPNHTIALNASNRGFSQMPEELNIKAKVAMFSVFQKKEFPKKSKIDGHKGWRVAQNLKNRKAKYIP